MVKIGSLDLLFSLLYLLSVVKHGDGDRREHSVPCMCSMLMFLKHRHLTPYKDFYLRYVLPV